MPNYSVQARWFRGADVCHQPLGALMPVDGYRPFNDLTHFLRRENKPLRQAL